MTFCPNCGVEVQAKAKFCYNCGEPIGGVVASAPPSLQTKTTPKRSTGYRRALTYADIGLGAAFQFLGLLTVLAPPLTVANVGFGGFMLLIGVASVAFGYGIAKGRGGVRVIGTFVGLGYLASGLVLLLDPLLALAGLLALVFGIATLYYVFVAGKAEIPTD